MAVTCSPSHFLFLVPVVRNCIILSAARTDLSLYALMYKFFYVQEFFCCHQFGVCLCLTILDVSIGSLKQPDFLFVLKNQNHELGEDLCNVSFATT